MKDTTSWQVLRSNIYIRDKGICWICNTFVDLKDYDLGHIKDRCNGGHDDYDNLAVMHESCNLAKPRHQTLEEALKWKLTAFIPAPKTPKPTKAIINRYKRRSMFTFMETRKRNGVKQAKISLRNSLRKRERYQEQIAKIKPATIVWINGRPQGGAMWRVLPPPYRQEDMFIMRQTPPFILLYILGSYF